MYEGIESEWLTYREAQRLVGLGRTTLWRLAKSGEIEVSHVGRAARINRSSLIDFMKRSAGASTGDLK
jgi:excisionase family DNA binding protein